MTTQNASPASPAATQTRPTPNHRALTDDEILGIITNNAARSAPRPTPNATNRGNSNAAPNANGNAASDANAAGPTTSTPNRGNVNRLGSGEVDDPFAEDYGSGASSGANVNANTANAGDADSDNSGADSNDVTDSNSVTNANANADATPDPAEFRAIFESNPPLREAWRDAQTFRELFPNAADAREIQKMFPTADAARSAGQQLQDLAQLDTLFFSNRPESHAELAAAVYRLNPAAFRNLARVMNAISTSATTAPTNANARAANAATATRASSAAPQAGNSPLQNGSVSSPDVADAAVNLTNDSAAQQPNSSQPAQHFAEDADAQPLSPAIPPEHAAFFRDTNAATVQGVFDAIHSQVDRLLPEGTSPAARQRLVAEIYREVDTSLRANPAFGQQLRQAFRGAGATPENQRAIVGMVVGRARQGLPGISKKVINEWTSAIVTRSTARNDRQRAAERRVDIASGSPGSDGRRALMPRDIDYRRMSDSDILNM